MGSSSSSSCRAGDQTKNSNEYDETEISSVEKMKQELQKQLRLEKSLASSSPGVNNVEQRILVLQKCLVLKQKLFGNTHESVLETFSTLVKCLDDHNIIKDNIAIVEEYLQLQNEVFGEGAEESLYAFRLLTKFLTSSFETVERVKKYHAFHVRLYGEKHTRTLFIHSNLVVHLYGCIDQNEQLIEVASACLALFDADEKTNVRREYEAVVLNHLATAMNISKQPNRAIQYSRRGLSIRNEIFGPTHDNTIIEQLNLSLYLLNNNQMDEAESNTRACYKLCVESFTQLHRLTQCATHQLALLCYKQKKIQEAIKLSKECLDWRCIINGRYDFDRFITLSNLIVYLVSDKQFKEVVNFCFEWFDIQPHCMKKQSQLFKDDNYNSVFKMQLILVDELIREKNELKNGHDLANSCVHCLYTIIKNCASRIPNQALDVLKTLLKKFETLYEHSLYRLALLPGLCDDDSPDDTDVNQIVGEGLFNEEEQTKQKSVVAMSKNRSMSRRQKNKIDRMKANNSSVCLICIICCDKAISHIFLPCSHIICCETCSKRLQKCPVCNKKIVNASRVYLP